MVSIVVFFFSFRKRIKSSTFSLKDFLLGQKNLDRSYGYNQILQEQAPCSSESQPATPLLAPGSELLGSRPLSSHGRCGSPHSVFVFLYL